MVKMSLGFVQKLTKASILGNVITCKKNICFNILIFFFLKEQKSISFSRNNLYVASKVNCISRKDDKDKNLFVQETARKSRWNLFSQIAIENDTLRCAKEAFNLTDICNDSTNSRLHSCTLPDTNEVVDIGFDPSV